MNRKIILVLLLSFGVVLAFWILSKNDQTRSLSELPVATPTKTVDIPDDWNTYPSSLNYSISYPDGYVIEPNGYYSIMLFKPMEEPGAGPFNFIYVSIVQPNMLDNEGEIYNYNPKWYSKLNELEVGDSRSIADSTDLPIFDEVMTYTRVDDTVIDRYTAKRFENNRPWEFPTGTTEVRYMFDKEGYLYILGYYYGGEGVADPIDAREAHKIVSSFHLK